MGPGDRGPEDRGPEDKEPGDRGPEDKELDGPILSSSEWREREGGGWLMISQGKQKIDVCTHLLACTRAFMTTPTSLLGEWVVY